MKYVLISGKQGSGKSSLQNALAEEWYRQTSRQKRQVFKINFADILYEMHDAVITILDKYWPKRKIVKDGPLLQLLGTEWGRGTIDTDIWVKCLKEKTIKMTERAEEDSEILFIVGDCRFPNELDAFPDAVKVRLEAPKEVRRNRCSMWRDRDDHPSETGLDEYAYGDKFDVTIYTDNCPIDDAVKVVIGALKMKGVHHDPQ